MLALASLALANMTLAKSAWTILELANTRFWKCCSQNFSFSKYSFSKSSFSKCSSGKSSFSEFIFSKFSSSKFRFSKLSLSKCSLSEFGFRDCHFRNSALGNLQQEAGGTWWRAKLSWAGGTRGDGAMDPEHSNNSKNPYEQSSVREYIYIYIHVHKYW